MTVYYKPPSRMVGDLLGAALLFAGGLITFVGLFWAGGWPLGGIILLLFVAFVVQFVATIITESRTTTTSIWTLSLIMSVWMLLWGVINIAMGTSPNGWLLMVLSLPIYVLGVVGGKIGTKMYQQQETARIAAARAAMDLVAPASGKGETPTGAQNAIDDDLDDQLSKRSEDTTVFSTKEFSKPVGAKPPAAGPINSKPPAKPPSPPPTKRLGL